MFEGLNWQNIGRYASVDFVDDDVLFFIYRRKMLESRHHKAH